MSISPSYEDYIRVGKQSPRKPVHSENAPSPEKINPQNLLKNVKSAPLRKSSYIQDIRSRGSKPLAEVSKKYIDRCVQGVVSLPSNMGRIAPETSADFWNGGIGVSGVQEPVEIDREKQVGQGSFSHVWQGTIQKTDKKKSVAIKEFHAHFYERELQVIDQLMRKRPQGVLRIYGKLTLPSGKTHVIMKLCNQGSALQFFNEHITDKTACHQKLLSMFNVLRGFHESGFCHRDIHEGNFLSHQPKKGAIQDYLADFGHAGSLKEGNPLPLYGRPLYLANSPSIFSDLYQEMNHSSDSQNYDQNADQYGKEIDLYQFGLLCFRVCSGDKSPLIMGVKNSSQVALVQKLANVQREIEGELGPHRYKRRASAPLKKELYVEKMQNYFRMEFPSIPPSLAAVMIGLLYFPDPMPLEQAIAQWKEGIQFMQEGY